MQLPFNKIPQRLLLAAAALALPLAASQAFAASATVTGDLTVTASVQSTISMSFSTATNGVTVTGTAEGYSNSGGTATGTIAFGQIYAQGTEPSDVTLVSSSTTLGSCTNCFEVQTPVGVTVSEYDSASSDFTLAAALQAADTQDAWAVGSTVLSTTSAQVGTTYTYGTENDLNINLAVPTTASLTTTSISNVIIFTAVAQ